MLKKRYYFFLIGVLITIYAFIFSLFFLNKNSADFILFSKLSLIDNVSIIFYIITLYVCLKSLKHYAFLLIFILLAFPSNVNNYLPSILFSSSIDKNRVFYPMITHVDIFLIVGLLKYKSKAIKTKVLQGINKFKLFLILFVIVSTLLSISYNVLKSNNLNDVSLIMANSFHLRYFLLLALLFFNTDIIKHRKPIFCGLSFAVGFLVIESVLYSYVFNTPSRLMSGTLRVNTFANIFAAIACYFTFLIIRDKINFKFSLIVFFMVLVIFLTTTRSALFLFGLYIVLEWLIYIRNNFGAKK